MYASDAWRFRLRSANLNHLKRQMAASSAASGAVAAPPPPPLCDVCGRKVKISTISCKCERVLCSRHVLPELHACSFDYREHGKRELRRTNPRIEPPKVGKL